MKDLTPCSFPQVSVLENVPFQDLYGFLSNSDAEEHEIGLRCAASIFLQFYVFSLLISPAIFGHGEAGSHPDTLQRHTLWSAATTHWSLAYSLQFDIDHRGKCKGSWALERKQIKRMEDRPRWYTDFTKLPFTKKKKRKSIP